MATSLVSTNKEPSLFIEEARRDIVNGRVYKGDLKKLLKKVGSHTIYD